MTWLSFACTVFDKVFPLAETYIQASTKELDARTQLHYEETLKIRSHQLQQLAAVISQEEDASALGFHKKQTED